jgi:hypothetical protein
MRHFNSVVFVLIAALMVGVAGRATASDDVIVVEQDYSIVEHGKNGYNAKDIRQVLYITADTVAIDEFGDNKSKSPTETFVIDLKNKRIVDLDHAEKKILLNEAFAERRRQIVDYKKRVTRDVEATAPGATKNTLMKLFGPMLDADRDYKLVADPTLKDVAGLKCKSVKIVDAKDPSYPAFETVLHPDIELPYDNSEVLFLLKIVGEKMAQYLKDNKATFDHVPMEMHLKLAEGGKLDVKVVSVKKVKADAIDWTTRTLGDPFKIPEDYEFKRTFTSTKETKDKAD